MRPPDTVDSEPVAALRQPALFVLLGAASLVVMAGAVVSPVITSIRAQFSISSGTAGLALTTHSLLIAVTGPLVGALIDRVGAKRVLVPALFGYAVFGAAGALAPTFALLLATRMLFGIAAAGVINAMTAAILGLWSGNSRNAVQGYRASATSAGGIAWPLIGGAVGVFGWRLPFAVYLVAIPIAIAAVVLLPSRITPTRSVATVQVTAKTCVAWLCLQVFVIQFLLYAIIVFVPQRLDELGSPSPLLASTCIALTNLAAASVGLGYARIRRRITAGWMYVLGFALPVAAFAALSLATSSALILLAVPFFGAGLALVLAAVPAAIADAVPPAALGRASAVMNSFLLIGQFVSPVLLGPIAATAGLSTVFVVAALVSALMALIHLPTLRTLHPNSNRSISERRRPKTGNRDSSMACPRRQDIDAALQCSAEHRGPTTACGTLPYATDRTRRG